MMNSGVDYGDLGRFPEIWLMDFEFIQPPGNRPRPVCCVALELRTSREVRLWLDDECTAPTFHPDALFVSYYASAELSCFIALEWQQPSQILDLFCEFRVINNGNFSQGGIWGNSLLAALAFFGLSHLDPDVKSHWRERIMAGPPYSLAERDGILDYCASDVYALRELLPAIQSHLRFRHHWVQHALLRGRYMKALAHIEWQGIPLDAPLLNRFIAYWPHLKLEFAREIEVQYPFYEKSVLRHDKFAKWLEENKIPWPRTLTGRLSVSEDSFKKMSSAYPILAPIRELRENLSKLRLTDISIGVDDRNRAMISAFRSRTGRNQPSGTRFIFAPSTWLRSLIKPGPGRALAYIDYSSQEIGVAAALSGDQAMIDSYVSGDPYLSFAKLAKLAPNDATRKSHGHIRTLCKALLLGTLYGMGVDTLAAQTGLSTAAARELLNKHKMTYARFWYWIQHVVDSAMLMGHIDTCFGWRLHIGPDTKPTSLLNHPMQSHGAEILRLACVFLVENGIKVCAPVHDAVLIEGPEDDIDAIVVNAKTLMGKASRIVLGGFEIRTDSEIVKYPNSYSDPRGTPVFNKFITLLEGLEMRQGLSDLPVADSAIP